jgi:hypothetical protein
MINGDVDIAVHSWKMFLLAYHKELFKLPFWKSQYFDILVHAILIFLTNQELLLQEVCVVKRNGQISNT